MIRPLIFFVACTAVVPSSAGVATNNASTAARACSVYMFASMVSNFGRNADIASGAVLHNCSNSVKGSSCMGGIGGIAIYEQNDSLAERLRVLKNAHVENSLKNRHVFKTCRCHRHVLPICRKNWIYRHIPSTSVVPTTFHVRLHRSPDRHQGLAYGGQVFPVRRP